MRSIVELRATAQALNIPFTFADDSKALEQKINLHMNTRYQPPVKPEFPEIDHRLRVRPAARMTSREDLELAIKPWLERGLRLEYPNTETWKFSYNKKHDMGTLRQPLRTILRCAEEVLS